MNTETRFKWLSALLGLSVLAIILESYYLWDLDKQLRAEQSEVVVASLPDNWTAWPDDWDPQGRFTQLQHQMNQLLSDMAPANSIFSHQGFGLSPSSPKITMADNSDDYTVTVLVPKGENVEVDTHVADNKLTINGKLTIKDDLKSGDPEKPDSSVGQTLAISQFSQTMDFPVRIDESRVRIKHNQDDIVITLPKMS